MRTNHRFPGPNTGSTGGSAAENSRGSFGQRRWFELLVGSGLRCSGGGWWEIVEVE